MVALTPAPPQRPRTLPKASTPPKSRPVPKARHAAECETLEQLPNIGPALAADLRLIGVRAPSELPMRDGYALYRSLCEATGRRQDPCVLDSFLAIVDFMRGAPPLPWWRYTAQRKARFGNV